MFFISMIAEAVFSFLVVAPFLILLQIIIRCTTSISTSIYHKLGTYVFCFLMAGIFSVTGIPSILTVRLDISVHYTLFTGLSSYLNQYVENIFLFVPYGFLLPLLWEQYKDVRKTVFSGFILSLTIEIMQLFCFRATDVNDLMMNTLGTLVGYLLFRWLKKRYPGVINLFVLNMDEAKKCNILLQSEVYIYILLTWLAMFFIQPFIYDWIFSLAT